MARSSTSRGGKMRWNPVRDQLFCMLHAPKIHRLVRAHPAHLLFSLALAFAAGCSHMKPPVYLPTDQAPRAPAPPRVVEEFGALWLADGTRLFRSIGVCAIVAEEVDYTRGGARYPLAYNGPAAHGGDRGAWANSTMERLRAWGFNTFGAWADGDLSRPGEMWHTPCLWFGGYRGQPDNRLIDVWDPAYAAEMDRFARALLEPWKDRHDVIGFFINNELPWYGEAGWPVRGGRNLLDRYLELPPSAPGRGMVADWLRTTYSNDFQRFLRDWETGAASFDDLRAKPAVRLTKRRPAAAAIVEAWAGVVAERYFALSDEIFRRHAPTGALNLGVRFAGRVYPSVLAACGKYADVVSFNDYQPAGEFHAAYFDALYALTRKPILITEFSWRADENRSGNKNSQGAPVTVPTQRDRAERYESYVSAAARHPAVIGWHWFCWADQPPGGRFDGEDSNYGIVDIQDRPYEDLVAAMRRVHQSLHRRGKLNPNADLAPLAIYKPIQIPSAESQPPAPIALDQVATRLWFDESTATQIEQTFAGEILRLSARLDPRGWGAGVSLRPPASVAKPIGTNAFSILGRRGAEIRLSASRPAKCRIQLVETGAGPVGEQAYAGLDGADGEVYISYPLALASGENILRVEWDALDVHEHYGNQRGNRRIDLQALLSIDLYLPGESNGAEPLTLEIHSFALW